MSKPTKKKGRKQEHPLNKIDHRLLPFEVKFPL
jgi:hypothetical protein